MRDTEGRTDGRTDRQHGDLISVTLLFKETRLKINKEKRKSENVFSMVVKPGFGSV
jgi:hypothetical protein